jgi:hypothetical protein
MKVGDVVKEEHWTASYRGTQITDRHIVFSAQRGKDTAMEFLVHLRFNFNCNQEMW